MKFITDLNTEEYENFVRNNPYKSHFLQSSLWGEFSNIDKGFIPHYVGIIKDGKILCASMLLEKKLILGFSYFYAPRGFVMNFEDKELLKIFTTSLKKYIKSKKGIFLKIDPDVIMKKYNYEDKELINDNKVYLYLKKLGYKHLGFTNRFETSQPRFTFRIDLKQSLVDIENNFSKTTKQRIKKANDMGVMVELDNNIEEFYKLITITENRKDFVTHSKKYYQDLYNIFSKSGNCEIFIGKINVEDLINKTNENIDSINKELMELSSLEQLSKSNKSKLQELEKRKDKCEKDVTEYRSVLKTYGKELVLSAHFIVSYGDKAWVLYAGNHNVLTSTYANYKTYFEHIKYYYDKGIKVYDQFGTVGKLEPNDSLLGLHEFKKKFGGDYVEFIGEFDLITNKLMYFLFKKIVPYYRKRQIIKNIKRLKNQPES